MNEILTMFLFTCFMLLSIFVIGISFNNKLIIIFVIITMIIIFSLFYLYMKHISKLANYKLKDSKDFNSFKLFINYILTSDINLKLKIDKETAIQIEKLMNNEIYTIKDIHIYRLLDETYSAYSIRNEIIAELEYLNNPKIHEMLIKAYNTLYKGNHYNYNILIVSLDEWIIQQFIHMKKNQTSIVESIQYEQLMNIIENIDEMEIKY